MLYEKIKEILKDRELSISSISRELEKKGDKIHRLALTGYLKALRDLGVLEERDVPPVKLFSLSSLVDSDIYSLVRRELEKLEEERRDRTGVFILMKILNRALTERELEKAGINPRGKGISIVSEEERREYMKSGLKISEDERMYCFSGNNAEVLHDSVTILSSLVRDLTGMRGLYPKFKQKKLV
ncbi:MAG: hypothetical protein H5T46_03155 [Archaeoglobi archaeon]|nr:hypothetical protein [Candidatus Mnemosynella sp.]